MEFKDLYDDWMVESQEDVNLLKEYAYERWCNAWNNAGFERDTNKRNFIFERFIWYYYSYNAATTRAYHNITHIIRCLKHFEKSIKHDDVKVRPSCPEEVCIALWLHDIIYDPRSRSNEQQSANLAKLIILYAGGSNRLAKRIEKMILLTAHSEKGLGYTTVDEQWLLDLDLSILGESPEVYEWYSKNIRKEYEHIPLHIYKCARVDILDRFMNRKKIYNIEYFGQLFTEQCLQNVGDELFELSQDVTKNNSRLYGNHNDPEFYMG